MLSSEQQAAISAEEQHVSVVACAGSGKTRVIVHRALKLVESGVRPEAIVIITYTNASAIEVKSRIDAEIGESDMFVGTMNGYALKALSESVELGTFAAFNLRGWASKFPSLWSIVDDDVVEQTIKSVRDEYGKKVTLKSIRAGLYSDLTEEIKSVKGNRERKARVLMRSQNNLSQDDLVVMLADGAKTLDIEHLIVDEGQDLPHAHRRFVDAVAGFASVFMCLDDAQSIFSFLSKRQEATGIPAHDFKNWSPTEYRLTQNFRSGEAIVTLANRLRLHLGAMGGCSELTQSTSLAEADVVNLSFEKVDCTADFNESMPEDILEQIAFEYMSAPSCALICRTWKDVALFKPYLMKAGLIDDVDMSLSLKLPANRGLLALARIIHRGGIKLHDLDDIKSCAWSAPKGSLLKQTADLVDLIKVVYAEEIKTPLADVIASFVGTRFWSEVGDIKTIDNLADSWQEIGGMPSPLLHHFAQGELGQLVAGADRASKQSGTSKVVTTVHGAKGLEWDTVLVYAGSEGVYPSSRDKTEELQLEAGRSLYVALTRAKRRLVILKPSMIRNKERKASPFLVN